MSENILTLFYILRAYFKWKSYPKAPQWPAESRNDLNDATMKKWKIKVAKAECIVKKLLNNSYDERK